MGACNSRENKQSKKSEKITIFSFEKLYPIGKGGFGKVSKIIHVGLES